MPELRSPGHESQGKRNAFCLFETANHTHAAEILEFRFEGVGCIQDQDFRLPLRFSFWKIVDMVIGATARHEEPIVPAIRLDVSAAIDGSATGTRGTQHRPG